MTLALREISVLDFDFHTRFVRWRFREYFSVSTWFALAIPYEECVINDGAEQTKERSAKNSIRKIAGSTREQQLD